MVSWSCLIVPSNQGDSSVSLAVSGTSPARGWMGELGSTDTRAGIHRWENRNPLMGEWESTDGRAGIHCWESWDLPAVDQGKGAGSQAVLGEPSQERHREVRGSGEAAAGLSLAIQREFSLKQVRREFTGGSGGRRVSHGGDPTH